MNKIESNVLSDLMSDPNLKFRLKKRSLSIKETLIKAKFSESKRFVKYWWNINKNRDMDYCLMIEISVLSVAI